MAKVKKLQVSTPQTTDGKNLAYDNQKQVIYKTSIVELSAKKEFESLNAKLPAHLRHELKEIEVDSNSKKENTSSQIENTSDENLAVKDQEIATLKQKISDLGKKPNAAFVISKIEEATTVEELNELVEDDDRATVIAAANKKMEALKSK